MFSIERFTSYFPKIIAKFPVTLGIVLVSFACGIILGLCFALIRLKKLPVVSQVVAVLVSYIRCTPPITQLFVVYFGLPILLRSLGVDTTNVAKVVYVYVAFGLNQAGFLSEVMRSSILAVPSGQTEAGLSVGLTGGQTFFTIVVPQALRIAMPMLGTAFVYLFQGTALAYMVGVMDMIGKARSIAAIRGHLLEGYLCAACVFIVISLILENVFKRLNMHLDFSSDSLRAKKVNNA